MRHAVRGRAVGWVEVGSDDRMQWMDDEATLTVVRAEHLPMEQKPSQERRRRYSSTGSNM